MPHELTKAEKKLARALIDKGIQLEYAKMLEAASRVIQEWKSTKLSNKDAYMEVYETVQNHDRHIAGRYNRILRSTYLFTVGLLLADGLISVEEIEGFSEESKAYLKRMALGK